MSSESVAENLASSPLLSPKTNEDSSPGNLSRSHGSNALWRRVHALLSEDFTDPNHELISPRTGTAGQRITRGQAPARNRIALNREGKPAISEWSQGANASQRLEQLHGPGISHPYSPLSAQLEITSEASSTDGDSLILRTELKVARQRLVPLMLSPILSENEMSYVKLLQTIFVCTSKDYSV